MTTFLPIITTLSGSSLLACDWKHIGVHALSLRLDSLLVKPGIELLTQLRDLGAYVGWDETIVLSASHLKKSNTGVYRIRSTFDGRISTYTEDELLHVIRQLNPAYFVVPSVTWADALADTAIRLIVPEHENTMKYEGVWRKLDQESTLFIDGTQIWQETEKPISLAVSGLIYTDDDEILDIKQAHMAQIFRPLVAGCACEACETNLTVSYFHHLFTQTPGLCQRFLIQHNVANYPTIKL